MIWILFYYNSLPDMPDGCSIFSPSVMHRDFFRCNPTNTGHYEYPKFESLSYDEGCHLKEVRNFLAKADPDKYVVFYTRHTVLQGKGTNKVVGYFRVGTFVQKPKAGFYASEAVLMSKEECITIPYASRGVPVSWGRSSVKNTISEILDQLRSCTAKNISNLYQSETQNITDLLGSRKGIETLIRTCGECPVKSNCIWGRKPQASKEEQLSNLYQQFWKC